MTLGGVIITCTSTAGLLLLRFPFLPLPLSAKSRFRDKTSLKLTQPAISFLVKLYHPTQHPCSPFLFLSPFFFFLGIFL